jgi:hypothetical protein
MSQFNDPAFGTPPPKKKSSAMMWVLIVLGSFMGLGLVCCGGCYFMGRAAINAGSAQIAKELENSPAVQEHLGANLKMSMNFVETANEQQKQGNDKIIVFDASGSKGSGKIIGVTSQGGGAQALESATLRMPNGQEHMVK